MSKSLFNTLPEVARGDLAEEIVATKLREKYFVLSMTNRNESHPADIALMSKKTNRLIMFLDVKCKTPFAGKDGVYKTGIDRRLFIQYKNLSEINELPVRLVFIDPQEGSARFVDIDQFTETPLSGGYWFQNKRIEQVYWKPKDLTLLFNLTEDEKVSLLRLSTRTKTAQAA